MKLMRKICLVLIGILMVMSITNTVFSADEVYRWKLQSLDTASMLGPSITQKAFCERIKEMSNGRLEISLFTAGELTPTFEIIGSMKTGMVDIAITSGSYYGGFIPEASLEASALPPLIIDSFRDAIQLYWYGGLDEIIRQGYAEQGVYFVGSVPQPVPIAFWSKKPMYGVEDFKGFKVRSFGYLARVLAELGAGSVSLPQEEVYTAISQGVIDGSMTDASYYEGMRFYEVAPYFYLPGFMHISAICMIISQQSWDALPNDLKAIVREAYVHYVHDHAQRAWFNYEQMLKSFDEKGVTLITFSDEDQQKIRERGMLILDEIAEKSELNKKGIELIKNYLKEKGFLK